MKKVLAALALSTFGLAPAAQATTYHGAHYNLAMTAERAGVRVRLNPKACQIKKSYGWYSPSDRMIVVCQEQALADGTIGQEVQWSAEDYDTLRHEVQHMVQDCMVGDDHDGLLGQVYKEPVELAEDVLGAERLRSIARLYYGNGASDHIVLMEFEAFAVAALDDPQEQVRDIQRYCM
jgi:hypothetical protein